MPVAHQGPLRPGPQAPIEVLIAHPEPAGQAVIRRILDQGRHVRVVGVAGDGDEAAAVAERLRPSVILVDARVSTPAGLGELARRSRVILLIDATEPHGAVAALLHEPARGYLIYDNFEPADLLGAVDAVARGLAWLSPIAAAAAVEQLRGPQVEGRPPPVPDGRQLTTRESQVLELLAQGLSNAAIAVALTVAEKTVRNHVSRGFAKLGIRDRAAVVRRLTGRS